LRQIKGILKNEELRLYIGMVVGSVALIVWNLRDYYDTFGETVRHAAFQVSTIMTTTGFATDDFNQWPEFSKAILLCLNAAVVNLGGCTDNRDTVPRCADNKTCDHHKPEKNNGKKSYCT
jgi:trk system potassium uptake protein TrkH